MAQQCAVPYSLAAIGRFYPRAVPRRGLPNRGRFGFSGSVAAAPASARRGEDRGKRSVLIQAIEERENDGQTTAAQNTVTETSVFRA